MLPAVVFAPGAQKARSCSVASQKDKWTMVHERRGHAVLKRRRDSSDTRLSRSAEKLGVLSVEVLAVGACHTKLLHAMTASRW